MIEPHDDTAMTDDRRPLWAGLCVLGTLAPLAAFLPFLRDHGLDARAFVSQLSASPVSAFFGLDVFVSALVVWALVAVEGRRLGMARLWMPIVATLLVGVSLALPLFLYQREAHLLAKRSAPGPPRRQPDNP